jgi:glycosyltransferase involved in cell wall biosynthesis
MTRENIALQSKLGIGWTPGSRHGWGIFGINLACQLRAQGLAEPVFLAPIESAMLDLSPAERILLEPVLAASGVCLEPFPHPLLVAQLDDFNAASFPPGGPRYAVTFQEQRRLSPAGRARALAYDKVIAGSEELADWLRREGIAQAVAVPQGVDVARFRRQAPARRKEGGFRIFSGGKLEFRKGQDLVIAAFREFHRRRPEAKLLFAWFNPEPELRETLSAGGLVSSPPASEEFAAWLIENGLPPGSFEDLGAISNRLLPNALGRMDVAIFPNRSEGGTNLVAMECMAMGLPTIISANTGHLDIIDEAHCWPLRKQAPVTRHPAGLFVEGWGESSLEEMLEVLEEIYSDRKEAESRGQKASAFMQNWSWAAKVRELAEVIGLEAG